MKKIDFENPKVRIKADVITIIILTLFALGMILYNFLLPNNTVIECNKNSNECKIVYTNILGHKSIKKDIAFEISNIEDVKFIPAHRMSSRSYKYANIVTKDRQFYNDVMHPSINEDDTKFLANRMNNYFSSADNLLYFNRNEEINSSTRKGFILGILIYFFIGFTLIISDIYCYKKKIN